MLRSPRHARSHSPRRGAVVLELLVAVPVLLVFLAAVVEFGLILAQSSQVAAASRGGAQWAAVSGVPFDATTLAAIRRAVDRQLQTAGFGVGASRGIVLEHTVPGGGPSPQIDGSCPVPNGPPLPTDGQGAVRVTVCVDLSRATPDLLATFGFSTAGRSIVLNTTLPYE